MEPFQPKTSTLKKTSNNRYENVILEVRDLLWDNHSSFIYNCKILNPINSIPMREGNFIAIHTEKMLSNNTTMETSIEIIEKSKYKATYKLVYSSDNHLKSSESLSGKDEMNLIEAEVLRDIESEEEAIADNMGISYEEYRDYQEYEASRDPEDY